MKKRFRKLDANTKRIIIFCSCILFISIIVLMFFFQKRSYNYNNIKQDKSKYLVYTKIEQNDKNYPKYVPYINIKSKTIDLVNNDIDNFVENLINENTSIITYEYDINGVILSVVVKQIDNRKDYAPEIAFRTYNINLNTKELISNESLLRFFQIDEEQVSTIIDEKFEEYYKDLVEQGYYVPEECDYKCFLKYKGVNNYLDNVNYYVKNGNLIAYKPFIFYSIFRDEDYFDIDKFEFLLVESRNVELD